MLLVIPDHSSPSSRFVSGHQGAGDGDEGHLRKVFDALDLDGNGEITVDELQQVSLAASPRLYE